MNKKRQPVDKNIGERQKYFEISNETQYDDITKICRALSSRDRLSILKLIRLQSMSVVEIANKLDIPVSSTAFHVRCLEDAGIIVTDTQPGLRGSMRVCGHNLETLEIKLTSPHLVSKDKIVSIEMPIGHYYDCDILPTCGLANEDGIIGSFDNPRSFYNPNKVTAQLLWFHKGYVEYRFPNNDLQDIEIENISFTCELCSEAPGYRTNWPSDISVLVNSIKVAQYHSTGDYGERHGLITPSKWIHGSTQYGLLKTFSVSKSGTFLDEQLYRSDITIDTLKLKEKTYISFVIAVTDDVKHIGGVNIFGEKFGDFPQGIIMRVHY